MYTILSPTQHSMHGKPAQSHQLLLQQCYGPRATRIEVIDNESEQLCRRQNDDHVTHSNVHHPHNRLQDRAPAACLVACNLQPMHTHHITYHLDWNNMALQWVMGY